MPHRDMLHPEELDPLLPYILVGRAGSYNTLSPEEKVLYNQSSAYTKASRAALDALFAPYNELLAELVGDDAFAWR